MNRVMFNNRKIDELEIFAVVLTHAWT